MKKKCEKRKKSLIFKLEIYSIKVNGFDQIAFVELPAQPKL